MARHVLDSLSESGLEVSWWRSRAPILHPSSRARSTACGGPRWTRGALCRWLQAGRRGAVVAIAGRRHGAPNRGGW
eukprot:13418095-Alexandrium_andersonii.AAC.1